MGPGKTKPIWEGSFKFEVSSVKLGKVAVGIPHYFSILLFHHSRPMPFVRNKPNSGYGVRRGKGFSGKELWGIARAIGLEKTKPIWEGSFRFGVSSVKQGKPLVGTSDFTLYTSHSAPGRPCGMEIFFAV